MKNLLSVKMRAYFLFNLPLDSLKAFLISLVFLNCTSEKESTTENKNESALDVDEPAFYVIVPDGAWGCRTLERLDDIRSEDPQRQNKAQMICEKIPAHLPVTVLERGDNWTRIQFFQPDCPTNRFVDGFELRNHGREIDLFVESGSLARSDPALTKNDKNAGREFQLLYALSLVAKDCNESR